MMRIEQVKAMTRDECRKLDPGFHQQHDFIAYLGKADFYKPFAYSQSKPIPPKYGWPDLPTDKHAIDVMIIVCLEKVGSDVMHISEVMDEYLDHLETQATVQDGGHSFATKQEQ